MLIALLALLGVDLVVVVVLLAGLIGRRIWVRSQPGAFKGAIRVTHGRVRWLFARWRRGYGRRVGNVLVWYPMPFLLRNVLISVDGGGFEFRVAEPGQVKRIGAVPCIASFSSGDTEIEVATAGVNRELVLGSATQ